MPERSQGTGLSSDEQWHVVDQTRMEVEIVNHTWFVVLLENDRGQQRRGLRCRDCNEVRLISDGGWTRAGSRVLKEKH